MKVVLRVGAMSVSCGTDYRPDPSGKCSENDAAQKALFERLLGVAVEKMHEWMFKPDQDAKDMIDLPSVVRPGDYVRKVEKALEPVLSVEGTGCKACHERVCQTEEEYKRNPKEFQAEEVR